MKTMTSETTVGEIVRAVPARSPIFENLGIAYCCGGKKPLAEPCRAKGLDPATVVAMLTALDGVPTTTTVNPDAMSLSELCDHIEEFHHGYLREELPRLDFLTRKVAAVHGADEPRLVEVRRVFESFQSEMASHTKDEDEAVFPAIRRLESENGDKPAAAANLKASFDKLGSEHENAGAALARFKELTDSYTPPDWACNTFRALYDGLAQLEKNTHQHVHKENNVLFPRARALQQILADPEVPGRPASVGGRFPLQVTEAAPAPSANTAPTLYPNPVSTKEDEPRALASPPCYRSEFIEPDSRLPHPAFKA